MSCQRGRWEASECEKCDESLVSASLEGFVEFLKSRGVSEVVKKADKVTETHKLRISWETGHWHL